MALRGPLRLYLIIVIQHIKFRRRFQLLLSDGRSIEGAVGPACEGERPVLNTTIMLFLLQDGITNGAIYALLGLAWCWCLRSPVLS